MTENNGRKLIDFMETLTTPTLKAIAKKNSDLISIEEENYTTEYIKEYIKSKKHISVASVITFCYFINLYARYIGSSKLEQAVSGIDKNALWKEIGANAKRFISHEEFKEIYDLIDMGYETNTLFKKTIFRCVWEGMFSSSLDIFKNLRATDVNGNVLTLRTDDGVVYDLEVSNELAKDLIELSKNNTWERANRYGYFNVPAIGIYPDSCFKLENRKGVIDTENTKHVYWRIIRDISNNYIQSPHCHAKQIFFSGIMYRIALKLKNEGISLDDAFAYDCKDRLASKIIIDELRRCNVTTLPRSFKETVDGYLDNFRV